jgi:DUF177 domain-containing protein
MPSESLLGRMQFSGARNMKWTVDVFELAREARSVSGEVESADLARLAPMLARPEGRIRFQMRARTDAAGRSAASLELQGQLKLTCDLCGSELDWPLDTGSVGFFFVEDEAQLGALPISVDGDEPLLGSHHLDLLDLVEDQTILSLPISPRHPGCEPLAQPDPEADASRTHPFAQLAALKRGRTDVK